MTPAQLEELGADIVLSNAYHLAQRPGVEVVRALGGLHALMGWDGPILTDSGGFQVMSLAGLGAGHDDGVHYRSHVDGRRGPARGRRTPSPMQEALGVDVAMSLDECVPAGASPAAVAPGGRADHRLGGARAGGAAARPTWRSSASSRAGLDPEQRAASAAALLALAVRRVCRRRSVGRGAAGGDGAQSPRDTVGLLPRDRPRYLMGMGTPARFASLRGHGV